MRERYADDLSIQQSEHEQWANSDTCLLSASADGRDNAGCETPTRGDPNRRARTAARLEEDRARYWRFDSDRRGYRRADWRKERGARGCRYRRWREHALRDDQEPLVRRRVSRGSLAGNRGEDPRLTTGDSRRLQWCDAVPQPRPRSITSPSETFDAAAHHGRSLDERTNRCQGRHGHSLGGRHAETEHSRVRH